MTEKGWYYWEIIFGFTRNIKQNVSHLIIHPARMKQIVPWYAICFHLSNFGIMENDLHKY